MVLGICGGVGSGKSEVMNYLQERYHAAVLGTDEIARELCLQGQPGYEAMVGILGERILAGDGGIDRKKAAEILFRSPALVSQVNRAVHPLVWKELNRRIGALREVPLIVMETALPGPETSDICDEIWYVYTSKDIRRERLMKSRGYSATRVDEMMARQPSEEAYGKLADWTLSNSGAFEETEGEIDRRLSGKAVKF